MKIVEYVSLEDFPFWSGAIDTAKYLAHEDFEVIEQFLEETVSPNNLLTKTEVNDFFWFEENTIAELLGYDTFEALIKDRE